VVNAALVTRPLSLRRIKPAQRIRLIVGLPSDIGDLPAIRELDEVEHDKRRLAEIVK
jgi:hypothetical protein